MILSIGVVHRMFNFGFKKVIRRTRGISQEEQMTNQVKKALVIKGQGLILMAKS